MKRAENRTGKSLNSSEEQFVECLGGLLHKIQSVLYEVELPSNITLLCRDVEGRGRDILMTQEDNLDSIINSIRLHFDTNKRIN